MTRTRRWKRRGRKTLFQRMSATLLAFSRRALKRGNTRRTRQSNPLEIFVARLRTRMEQQQEQKGSLWWVPYGSVALIGFGSLILITTLPSTVTHISNLLLRGQRFQLSSVEVAGNYRLQAPELVSVLQLRAGTALVDLDPKELRAKLEALPEVEGAQIVRLPPSRLLVSIQEVWPQAWTYLPGGTKRILVDPEGRPYAPALPMDKYTLPSIHGAENVEWGSPNPRLREAIALAHSLAMADDLPDVRSIHILKDTEIPGYAVVFRTNQQQFLFGRSEFDETIARLNLLRDAAPEELAAAVEIDLRFRNQVVLRGVPTLKKVGKSGGHAWMRRAVHHKTLEETRSFESGGIQYVTQG